MVERFPDKELTVVRSHYGLSIKMFNGWLHRRRCATDCKSVSFGTSRFESDPPDQIKIFMAGLATAPLNCKKSIKKTN